LRNPSRHRLFVVSTLALLVVALYVVAPPQRPGSVPGHASVKTSPLALDTISDPALVTAADEIVVAPIPASVERTTLGHGGTLYAALERLGVPADAQPRLLRTVSRYLDVRKLSARTGITALSDDAGVRRVSFRASADRYLRVTLRGDEGDSALRAELLRLPVVASVETAGGVIEQSVAQALAGSPHGVQLTGAFAEIFQWDVDLLVDPRPGDHVRLVYEALRLGEVPEDLPSYGRSPIETGEFLGVSRVLAASYEGRMAHAVGFWVGDALTGDYYDTSGQPLRKTFLKSPLNYRRISSGFSRARVHPVTRRVVPHHGVDFAASPGTPVVATADGRVVSAGWDGPLGRAVRIRHGSGYVTIYGHLRGFARGIRSGLEVRQNQVIGYVGSTGRATGPHLHFGVIQDGRPINPLALPNPPTEPLSADQMPRLAEAKRRWLPALNSIVPQQAGVDFAGRAVVDDQIRSGS